MSCGIGQDGHNQGCRRAIPGKSRADGTEEGHSPCALIFAAGRDFSLILPGFFSFLAPAFSQADEYIDGRQAMTLDEPGAFVGLATTAGVNYMGPDPLVPTGGNVFSYAAALDTGSSGCVVAAFIAQGRSLPTVPGASYDDVGIGGTETFNVSQPTQVKMASVGIGGANCETLSYFSSYGNYNLQVRQSDPSINVNGFLDPVYVNVIGTPVLNKYVMHVQPNSTTFPYYVNGGIDLGIGFNYNVCPVNYLETNLLPSAPSYLYERATASWFWSGRATGPCCTCL